MDIIVQTSHVETGKALSVPQPKGRGNGAKAGAMEQKPGAMELYCCEPVICPLSSVHCHLPPTPAAFS
jgi:hypothetical protein